MGLRLKYALFTLRFVHNKTESDESSSKEDRFFKEIMDWLRQNIGDERELVSGSDSDWKCIITLHAMIETGLNGALVKQLQASELSRVIAKLDTSNPATGKIAFAKALKILKPETCVFVQKLSELRNFCVHDVRNFKFDLEKYLEGLGSTKRNQLMKPILKLVEPEVITKVTPRLGLFAGTLTVIAELYIHDLGCQGRELDAQLRKLQAELFKRSEATGGG